MKMKRQARAFVFLPVLALLCCFFAGGAYAQRVAVTLKATDAPLEQVLDAIEKQTTYLVVYDKSVKLKSPRDAVKAGIVCAPEDRKKDGLLVELDVSENIAIANLDTLSNPVGVLSAKRERDMANRAVKELKIKTPSIKSEVKNLSGGNQQKIVVGKWLMRDAKVIIFDEPTRGIDVAAKVEIYNLMNKLKKSGIGVMFVSSELPEVLGMSDRIIVMCSGRITGELSRDEATQEKIMELATKFRTEVS